MSSKVRIFCYFIFFHLALLVGIVVFFNLFQLINKFIFYLFSGTKARRNLIPAETVHPERVDGTGNTTEAVVVSEPTDASEVFSTSLDLSSPVSVSERDSFCFETANLRAERNTLIEQIQILKCQMSFHYSAIANDAGKCHLLTGLHNDVLKHLITYLKDFCENNPNFVLCREDQLILTLVKLRHNPTFDFLVHIAGIRKSTANDYFWKWIDILHPCLKFLIKIGDREQLFKIIPPVFKSKFPRLTSIIDCFEIFIDSPSNLLARAQCYSHYKKHTTIKVFISCTPLGAVNFVSTCWGGRASDIQIVRESSFPTTHYHMPGDQILADRGFTLREDFALNSGSELIIPAFTKEKNQLSAHKIESTRKIVSVRIHIERVIRLIKNRYTTLKGIMPIRCLKSIKDEQLESPLVNCDKIVTVCAALVNLGESIVYNEN